MRKSKKFSLNQIVKVSVVLLLMLVLPGYGPKRIDFEKGRFKNVCKNLSNDILVYIIFIDSKETKPWTEFDINTTLDSLSVAVRWLESQARNNNIPLKIKTDYYIGEYATITKSLPRGNVFNSVTLPNLGKGISEMNNWADFITKRAGSTFNIVEKDGIPEVQHPRNKERLIAHLRDEYSVESVALLFMVNNYFKRDISIALNTLAADEIEFAVVSYKYPSEIAHNILHLYGAADLYPSPFRRHEKKIKLAEKYFPKDIMQDPYAKNIWNLEIGEFTRYLIGWMDLLDSQYRELLTDKVTVF